MIRSSVNLDCFISVSLQVTDSTHFWRTFRGSGHTVYPIGVDSIPKRDDWKLNEKRSPQHPSIFEPAEASLRHRLIEKPININAAATMSSSDVEVSHRVISKQ